MFLVRMMGGYCRRTVICLYRNSSHSPLHCPATTTNTATTTTTTTSTTTASGLLLVIIIGLIPPPPQIPDLIQDPLTYLVDPIVFFVSQIFL